MHRSLAVRAFSLVEVIIAVGLFAIAVTAVLGLLPPLTRQAAETSDRLAAQRLPDAVKAEMVRLAAGNFDGLAAGMPLMGTPLGSGLPLVATRDGSRLHARDFRPPSAGRIADSDQYFLVEVWRFPSGPLAYDPAQSALAMFVRVSWPYRQPGSTSPTAPEARHELVFTVALNR
jgi:hypothetical protein